MKMKLNWKSVSEFSRNYVGQAINNGDAEITEIFVADGPICECGKPLKLMKCVYKQKDTGEEETEDITSICEECGIEDVHFFVENENNEIEW